MCTVRVCVCVCVVCVYGTCVCVVCVCVCVVFVWCGVCVCGVCVLTTKTADFIGLLQSTFIKYVFSQLSSAFQYVTSQTHTILELEESVMRKNHAFCLTKHDSISPDPSSISCI